MSLNKIWEFFTYIFRVFKKDKRPEYTKVCDNDDEYEIEFNKLNDFDTTTYNFLF